MAAFPCAQTSLCFVAFPHVFLLSNRAPVEVWLPLEERVYSVSREKGGCENLRFLTRVPINAVMP